MEQQRRIHVLANELAQAAATAAQAAATAAQAAATAPSLRPPSEHYTAFAKVHDKTSDLVIKIGSLALGSHFNKAYMHIAGVTASLIALLPVPPPHSSHPHVHPSFVNSVCRTLKSPPKPELATSIRSYSLPSGTYWTMCQMRKQL